MRDHVRVLWCCTALVLWVLVGVNEARAQTGWTVTDLGTLGGEASDAEDINDAGQVVGGSRTPDGNVRAFLWTRSAGLTDLGTLGGARSEAVAINEVGQVVGSSMPADPMDPFPRRTHFCGRQPAA